jgi:hypothetical protein
MPAHAPAASAGPAARDQPAAADQPAKGLRSWPLLVLAAPAATEVWSGWIGIAQKTGFGQTSPLPGIWPSLHLNTTITLPVGVEAYAAYALNAWLARDRAISDRTRRFAKWSAICSFALGMAGQVSYHLLAQSGAARAPWAITTIVSCLPVLVLAMGTTLAHMIRADKAPDAPHHAAAGPAIRWSPADQVQARTGPPRTRTKTGRTRTRPCAGPAGRPGPGRCRGRIVPGSAGPGRGPLTRMRTWPGWRPAGWSHPAGRFLGGHCGAAASGAPTKP